MPTTEPTRTLTERFRIATEREGNAASLAFSGALDADGVFELERALLDSDGYGVRSMILDLRRLTGVDPASLAEMLSSWVRSPRQTLEVILVRVPISLRRALEQAGLDHALPIAYESDNGSRNGA
jgi:anti-anti-sigma factor